MLVIETTTDIAAPPLRVWRALCDFKTYPRWNPYREIEGAAVLGSKVVLLIGPATARRHRVPATISDFRPGELLTLTSGRPPLSRSTESFVLERSARGTLLRHRAEVATFWAFLLGGDRFKVRLLSVYGAVDQALKQHVSSGKGPLKAQSKRLAHSTPRYS